MVLFVFMLYIGRSIWITSIRNYPIRDYLDIVQSSELSAQSPLSNRLNYYCLYYCIYLTKCIRIVSIVVVVVVACMWLLFLLLLYQ